MLKLSLIFQQQGKDQVTFQLQVTLSSRVTFSSCHIHIENIISPQKGGKEKVKMATEATATPTATAVTSHIIQHVASKLSAPTLKYETSVAEYTEWESKIKNSFSGNKKHYFLRHMQQLIYRALVEK